MFRASQGYETAVIVAPKKREPSGAGASPAMWHGVATLRSSWPWTAEKSPSKMEVYSWDNIQMDTNG